MKFSKYLYIFLALLLSVIIWCYSRLTVQQRTIIRIPIHYVNLNSADKIDVYPGKVRVGISGKGIDILKFIFSEKYAQYNAKDLITKKQMDHHKISIDVPNSIQVDFIEEDNNTTAVSNNPLLKQAAVDVELAFADKESKSKFISGNYVVNPNKIILTGSDIKISKVKTEPITLKMINNNKLKVSLIIPKNIISVDPKLVEIGRVDPELHTRVIHNILIKSESNISYYPKVVSAIIRGRSDVIKSLTTADFAALPVKDEETGKISLKIIHSIDCDIVDYSPKFLTKTGL
jgi:hypothetical protein